MSIENASQKLSISAYCHNCLEHYRVLCDELGVVTNQQAFDIGFDLNASRDFIQDARSRFKAWAVNIAALQGAHLQSSLESRLKEATEVRERILKILKALAQSLWDASMIINGSKTNEKWEDGAISDSDEDNASTQGETTQTSDLEQLFIAIKTANSSLMKLSMIIRNSPARDDYLKAASRYPFDARYDIGHVKEKYGAAKRSSDWLLERLGKAITRRRQYLKYREEHHTKLSRDWENATVEEMVAIAEFETPLISTAKATEDERPEKTIALTKLTKATTFVENKIMIEHDGIDLDQGSFGSQTSYEPTVVGEAVNKLSVPPPPIMAFEEVAFEFGEPFQCPYCYMEQTVTNKTAWKKHVFRDLKPYVCTFRECNLKMFRSRNEWFAHEIQNHRREWICVACLDTFTEKAKFSEHLQSMHSNLVAQSQLEALLLQCEEPVDKIPASACHLCDEWESNLLDPKQDSKRLFLNNGAVVEPYGTVVQFRRHLGRHMEQLALFALPMAEDNEMEDDSVEDSSNDGDPPEKKSVPSEPKDNESIDEASDVDTIPEALKGPILAHVHFETLERIDDVVNLLFEEFRPNMYPGQKRTAHLPTNGALFESQSEIDKDRNLKFTKQALQAFIEKNSSRDSWKGAPWLIKLEVASLYGFDTYVPPHLRGDAYHYGIVDVAVEKGATEVLKALKDYPLLLARPHYHRYLRQKISKLPASTQASMDNHISLVLNTSILIQNIDATLNQEELLGIIDDLAIPPPAMLTPEYINGFFTSCAFARFLNIKMTKRAVSELDGFLAGTQVLVVQRLRELVQAFGLWIDERGEEQADLSEDNTSVDKHEQRNEAEISAKKRESSEIEQETVDLAEGQSALEQEDIDSRSIFIDNLNFTVSPQDVRAHFQSCGRINGVSIHTRYIRNFAYVEFTEPISVHEAVKLDGSVLRDCELRVVPKKSLGSPEELSILETNAARVTVGDTLPLQGFGGEIKTDEGKKTTLEELVATSRNGVLIWTFAKAGGPEAITQACEFRDRYEPITGCGFSIYGLSNDSTTANTNFREKYNLPYHLLCDSRSTLISAIGLQKFQFGTTPGVFMVDKLGRVLEATPCPPSESWLVVNRVLDRIIGSEATISTTGAAGAEQAAAMQADSGDGTTYKVDEPRDINQKTINPPHKDYISKDRDIGTLGEGGTTVATEASANNGPTEEDLEIMTVIMQRIREFRDEDGQDRFGVFQRLVSRQSIPAYFDLMKEPVTLNTFRQKGIQCPTFKSFVEDFALICYNAQTFYHPPSSIIYNDAELLRELFEGELKKLVDDKTITPEDAELPDLGGIPENEESVGTADSRGDSSPGGASEAATPSPTDVEGGARSVTEQLASMRREAQETGTRRRSRIEDLEEMMMMEAIRLSLAAEEERKTKADKEATKEAKKKEKRVYGSGASLASGSALSLSLPGPGRRRGNSGASNLAREITAEDMESPTAKGKGVDRSVTSAPSPLNFAAVGAAVGTEASHHPRNTSARLDANDTGIDEQNRTSEWYRTVMVHLLAVQELSEAELCRKLGTGDTDGGLRRLPLRGKQTLEEVALLWSPNPPREGGYEDDRWHLRPDLYRELDVWNFPYEIAEDRNRAINNATNQYRQLNVGSDEPEWARLLPEAERTPLRRPFEKNERVPNPAQNPALIQAQEDEIIALAAAYGEDFRELPPTLDQGWKRFEIRIKSSQREAFTLRVTLPATYPWMEPELSLQDYLSLGDLTQPKIRKILDTQLELMRGNEDERPKIMDIVNACSDVLEHAVQEKAASKESGDDVQEAKTSGTGSFVFRWEHPAQEVYVTGTFDNWSKSEKLVRNGDVFEKKVVLPLKKIYYKFVVDGFWATKHTNPQEKDAYGNLSNFLTPEIIARGHEALANNGTMSFEDALEFLNVSANTASDSIEAAAVALSLESSDKAKIARALRVIAYQRSGNFTLRRAATSIELGNSGSRINLDDAYYFLQIGNYSIPDDIVFSHFSSLYDEAPSVYNEALRVIAAHRQSEYLLRKLEESIAGVQAGTAETLGLDNQDGEKTTDTGSTLLLSTGKNPNDTEIHSREAMESIIRAQPTVTMDSNSDFYSVIIREPPTSLSKNSLERYMQDSTVGFVGAEVLASEISKELGLGSHSAILRFQSHQGALVAKKLLDQLHSSPANAQMIVEVVQGWTVSRLAMLSAQLQHPIRQVDLEEPEEHSSLISSDAYTNQVTDVSSESEDVNPSSCRLM